MLFVMFLNQFYNKMSEKVIDKWWRPRSIDAVVVSKLEEAFKRDASIQEACAYVGISSKTYYRELKRNSRFRDKMEQAKLFPHMIAKSKFFDAMYSNDPYLSFKASAEFLKRRNEERKEKPQDITINNTPRFSCIEIIDATWETTSTTDKKTAGTSEELQW